MGKQERDVDSMKYRKSTHLAGVDVEMLMAESKDGKCNVTINDAYYAKGVDVSGNKTDGYFIEFEENIKGMMVNSGNRKNINKIVKVKKGLSNVESRNLTNWIGVRINLYFDEGVKMMGKMVGGIKVSPQSPIADISDEGAKLKLSTCKTLVELQAIWGTLSKDEQGLPTVVALKEKLKLN